MKIAVLGYSGSGKSTLAKQLADFYQIPVLFLDTVQFLPGWQERNREEALTTVRDFMKNDSWVIDGNYSEFLQKERLEQADQILILNFSRGVCLFRALNRYFNNRGRTRESMAAGCAEKIDLEFIWWILYEGRTSEKRACYKRIAARYREKTHFLKDPGQVDAFMAKAKLFA